MSPSQSSNDDIEFLAKHGSKLSKFLRMLKNAKKSNQINTNEITNAINSFREELKRQKAAQLRQQIPSSLSVLQEKAGGENKLVGKVADILIELIRVDPKNSKTYGDLLTEFYEVASDGPAIKLSKQQNSNDGLSDPSEEDIEISESELTGKEKECLKFVLCCAEGDQLSKGVLVNMWMAMGFIDDPTEGEQVLTKLVVEDLIKKRSNNIMVSPSVLSKLKSPSTLAEVHINKTRFRLSKRDIKQVNDDNVKVLHLGRWQSNMDYIVAEDSLFEINNQKKGFQCVWKSLVYLSLQGISRIQKLQESICSNLSGTFKVLDVSSCQDLRHLPKNINCLTQLMCLDLSECYQLESIPKGIGLLSNLRVFKGFIIGDSTNHYSLLSSEFSELSALKQLMKLTIRTRNMEFPSNHDLLILQEMHNLQKLKLTWVRRASSRNTTSTSTSTTSVNDHYYTNGFPTSLKKLDLQAAPKATTSRLLGLISRRSHIKVEKLYIRGGGLTGKLHPYQYCFLHIRFLRLRYLHQLHIDWPDFQLLFPNLSHLHVYQCPNLIFLPCDDYWEWHP